MHMKFKNVDIELILFRNIRYVQVTCIQLKHQFIHFPTITNKIYLLIIFDSNAIDSEEMISI